MLILRDVAYTYKRDGRQIPVFKKLDMEISHGEACSLIGASGSGKSTLLNLIGLLDSPTGGRIYFCGEDLSYASADRLALIRGQKIGFVFQAFNLLPRLTAIENVALPLLYQGVSRTKAHLRAEKALADIGLLDRATHRPGDLSGGQCQRVAVARALVTSPSIIIADEPTGNLDDVTANIILESLMKLNRISGTTLIIVTHDRAIARMLPCQYRLQNGLLSCVTKEND